MLVTTLRLNVVPTGLLSVRSQLAYECVMSTASQYWPAVFMLLEYVEWNTRKIVRGVPVVVPIGENPQFYDFPIIVDVMEFYGIGTVTGTFQENHESVRKRVLYGVY